MYNDCLYSNLHNYNYIAVLDIDEVGGRSLKLSTPISITTKYLYLIHLQLIMPQNDTHTWRQMLRDIEDSRGKNSTSYVTNYTFKDFYFWSEKLVGQYSKGTQDVEQVY